MVLLFAALGANAQWQPDVRLTNNSAESTTSNNNARSVASNGNVVHVVWEDSRDGNSEIYYKRSTDGGLSWGADIRLTNDAGFSSSPSIAVSAEIVHVTWIDDRGGSNRIYYKRSTNSGTNWEADRLMTNYTSGSYYPSIAASTSVVHLVWTEYRDSNPEIIYNRSTDGGLSWGQDIRLTNDPATSFSPSVTVSGELVLIFWSDGRDGNFEIYYKRSSNGGANWADDTRFTNNTAVSYMPTVAISASLVHVVWQDYINSKWELYYERSTDGGLSWGASTRLTISSGNAALPSITASASLAHVVWCDERYYNTEIYYKRSIDGGANWGADERLTNDTNASLNPSVAVSASRVHVVWRDTRAGNSEIYYKQNITGNTGITRINSEIPTEYTLGQNYPNPFNARTAIRFQLPAVSEVQVKVYDVMGREVQTLVNERLQPGTYSTQWNASAYSSGVYFYRMTTDGFSETKRMLLIK